MFRCTVHVRDALPTDVEALREVFVSTPGRSHDVVMPDAQARGSVAAVAADPDQRLLVAVIDDEVVGAVHLVRGSLSPLHPETAIHVLHLHVRDECRRHGVGRALMEATVSWAEEKDTSYVLAAASVGSRDANRFMARLGLGQIAVMRAATVASLRARLPVDPPAAARVGARSHRSVTQVLAQRRSMRRAQAKTS